MWRRPDDRSGDRKGAGVLRTDYVAEPGTKFDGNRWNDLHYTLAAKRAARSKLLEVR